MALKFGMVTVLLGVASVIDIRKRKVPNLLCVLAALCGLLPPVRPCIAGMLVALPMLMVGAVSGGIGGGDVKLVAALGFSMGLERTVIMLIAGLVIMLAVDALRCVPGKVREKEGRAPLGKNARAYPLVPFLFAGHLAVAVMCEI